ncbi:NAD(P)H-dependent oxidoreductase [Ferrimonas senticii]|uniref:NAD(P)H-dependent oxidoreductase n=1 Tax=Ferrimonas senticii TaxID=394566 RepID=UPI0003FF4C60|nr:NAD(P)H-dependent oxidoreductase [Ferrimonas senticii]
MNVLVIDGHPDLTKSTANAAICQRLQQHTDWQINHLGSGAFDVEQQQQALLAADLVVVQFPLYWSAFPCNLKRWVDEVFTYGFAFGPQGSKLADKKLIFSVTAGAKGHSYSYDGFNLMPFAEYQKSFEHAFRAAQMHILPTHITFEMNANPNEGGDLQNCLQLAEIHAQQLIEQVNGSL